MTAVGLRPARGHDGSVAVKKRWNHNIHYHPFVLDALPPSCDRVLDVGCGEGLLTFELSRRVGRVTAIDRDAPIVEVARRDAAADTIDYVVGDVLDHPFVSGSFDAVVLLATLHHVDLAEALGRLRDLLRPGGTLVAVGLADTRLPADLPYEIAGAVSTRVHRLMKNYGEVSAPMVWPPPTTFAEARRIATEVLPGVRYRRHILWRYSLVWTKPDATS